MQKIRTRGPASGNFVREFDLANLNPGDVLTLITERSTWYFTRTTRSVVLRDVVRGAFVQTNSRSFGQVTRHPETMDISRVVYRGLPFGVGDSHTGDVEGIIINGVPLILV